MKLDRKFLQGLFAQTLARDQFIELCRRPLPYLERIIIEQLQQRRNLGTDIRALGRLGSLTIADLADSPDRAKQQAR